MDRRCWAFLAVLLTMPLLPATAIAEPTTISWEKGRDYVDQEVVVVGTVVRASRVGKGTVFLNFADKYRGTLSIHIPAETASEFASPPETYFRGKAIKVRGTIVLFKGDPSLTVTDPKQITLADRAQAMAASSAPAAECGLNLCPEEYTPTIAAAHAGQFLNESVIMIGKVLDGIQMRSGHVSMDMDQPADQPVKIFIRQQYLSNFPRRPTDMFKDKMVRITGDLYMFEDRPNISVSNPSQIKILPDDTQPPAAPIVPVSIAPTMAAELGPTLTVASFNVENLFDGHDDPHRGDDVRDAKPRAKMELVAKTMRRLDADVVALVEVENRFILEQFCKVMLPELGYEVVLLEGNDMRGIDVAVLSRLPVGPVTSHRHLRFPDSEGQLIRFRRDLLRVRIEPSGGMPFDVFVVHFKSKGGKEEGGIDTRIGEAKQARAIFDHTIEMNADAHFVVCGDFNDTIDSEPLQLMLGSGPLQLKHFVNDLPQDKRITYNQEPFLSMIDFILASPAMARRYIPKSYSILPGGPDVNGSDHNAVFAKFRGRSN